MHALKRLAPATGPREAEPTAPPLPREAPPQVGAGAAQSPPSAARAQVRPAGIVLGRMRRNAMTALMWMVSLSLLLAVWYLGTRYRVELYVRFTNIPTPAEVLSAFLGVNESTRFMTHIGISVRRILSGFGIAALVGIPLGVLIGRYGPVRNLLLPICEVLRPIPAIAWVPMAIMLWPTNEASIVFITFLGSFFPILLNTIHGVESIDKVLVRAGQCLGAREPALLWHVILPGALPHIFTGLAVGMGVAWVSLIAAEMISGQFGVGYFTWEAYSLISYPEIVLGMITIGVLGLLCSGALRGASRIAMPWLAYSSSGGKQ